MTKSWEDIREEACRLYLSGKSLSQVQEHLEAKFNFKASTRSYRLRFKQWRVTRASQLKDLQEHNVIAGRRQIALNGSAHAQDGMNGISSSVRRNSLPPDPRLLETSTESLRQRLQASELSSNPDAFWTEGSTNTLEAVYARIRGARADDSRQVLSETSFIDGYDTILHYAATRDDPWTLNRIVEYVLNTSLSLDVTSSKHRTALEIGIREGRNAVVHVLLRAGASVSRRNKDGQQPLHFAISELAEVEICRMLIASGADVNSPCLSAKNGAVSPMYMTLERYIASRKDHEKDVLCGILQELTKRGAKMTSKDGESAMMKFVTISAELNCAATSVPDEQNRPLVALGYYLNAGRDPLCWLPKQCCPAHECTSFAAFIFAHTPKSGLSKMLIENTDMARYGLDMVHVLLAPCKMRYSSVDDPTVNDLLRLLLQRMRDQQVRGFLRPGLVRQITERTPLKKRLERLGTLLDSGYVSENECLEALARLNDINDQAFRLAVSEILLSPFRDVLYEAFEDIAPEFFAVEDTHFQDISRPRRLHEETEGQLVASLGISPPDRATEACIVQAIVNVYTKLMLQSNLAQGLVTEHHNILYAATALRDYYQLPDIPIAKELLLALRTPPPPQNKRLRVAHGHEYTSSPDSSNTVSDSAYTSPHSI